MKDPCIFFKYLVYKEASILNDIWFKGHGCQNKIPKMVLYVVSGLCSSSFNNNHKIL